MATATANVFIRYDLLHEGGTKTVATAKDETIQKVIQCVIDGDSDNIEELVSAALQNHDPRQIYICPPPAYPWLPDRSNRPRCLANLPVHNW